MLENWWNLGGSVVSAVPAWPGDGTELQGTSLAAKQTATACYSVVYDYEYAANPEVGARTQRIIL